jgi:protocatechuate 3,4-dioxygenase beta subunit
MTLLLLFALFVNGGPCRTATAKAVVAGPQEPGTRISVSGQVLQPDGKTPAAGVTMYVYHTDNTGRYAPPGVRGARLQAWLKTDAQGRYEFTTIRPGMYPDGSEPAHIHYQFWGTVPHQWNEDLVFDEKDQRTAFVKNFRLKAKGDDFDPIVLHGIKACAY